MTDSPPFAPTHIHVKSQKYYRFIGYGRRESDLDPRAYYVGVAGDIWDRPRAEFDDGRFAPVTLAHRSAMSFAWVIECGGSKVDKPLYFSGMDGLGRFKWSFEHEKAVRFARKSDAEAITAGDRLGTTYRISEHGWSE